MADLVDDTLSNPPRLQRESSPIVEEPVDVEPALIPRTDALLHDSTATVAARDVVVTRPTAAPPVVAPSRITRAPLPGVLRQPSNLMSNESRRGSVEFTSGGRLRFDSSILQSTSAGTSNSATILPSRQTLLNHVDATFVNDIEPDYSTPDWSNSAVVTERSRLAPNSTVASTSGGGAGGYYQSLPSANTSNASNGGPEGYEDEAYDDDDPVYIKSVYMLSCSILFITSVVFVIIVSGLTTLYSRRNMPRFEIRSDWPRGGFIPDEYGCNAPGGAAISIPIEWQNVPKKANNLVVLFANADSVDVHWLVTDIPLQDTSGRHVFKLPANASENSALMPSQARQRANKHLENGHYFPPCPKHNTTNMFVLHAYAIEASARIDATNVKEARQIMNGFVGVPSARFSGKYGGAFRHHGDLNVDADSHHANHHESQHDTHDGHSHSSDAGHHNQLTHDHSPADENHATAAVAH